jgi:hypothetical protein
MRADCGLSTKGCGHSASECCGPVFRPETVCNPFLHVPYLDER